MSEIIYKLPDDEHLSPDLKGRAVCGAFMVVTMFGQRYYVPITKGIKKLAGLKVKDGKIDESDYEKISMLEEFLRDVINSMYLQVRDTVGAEIHDGLMQEMKNGFANMFSNAVEKKVGDKLQKSLPYHGGKNDRH